ncbi:MAG TPA: hypothetical protein VNJ54_15870 [Plantibacter sp.]|uniref:hypothetical protein n=1 Tax=unclassified Plantibacter TaxID=2624265 RepID=UPI002BD59047|nr:hypothetical protein [Plantibacter sp.]
MSISALNDALKLAKDSSSRVIEPAGTKSLDEVLVSDLYAEGFESSATTSFITIIDAPGVPSTLAGNTCVANTVCLCASAETEDLLPARFE